MKKVLSLFIAALLVATTARGALIYIPEIPESMDSFVSFGFVDVSLSFNMPVFDYTEHYMGDIGGNEFGGNVGTSFLAGFNSSFDPINLNLSSGITTLPTMVVTAPAPPKPPNPNGPFLFSSNWNEYYSMRFLKLSTNDMVDQVTAKVRSAYAQGAVLYIASAIVGWSGTNVQMLGRLVALIGGATTAFDKEQMGSFRLNGYAVTISYYNQSPWTLDGMLVDRFVLSVNPDGVPDKLAPWINWMEYNGITDLNTFDHNDMNNQFFGGNPYNPGGTKVPD